MRAFKTSCTSLSGRVPGTLSSAKPQNTPAAEVLGGERSGPEGGPLASYTPLAAISGQLRLKTEAPTCFALVVGALNILRE